MSAAALELHAAGPSHAFGVAFSFLKLFNVGVNRPRCLQVGGVVPVGVMFSRIIISLPVL